MSFSTFLALAVSVYSYQYSLSGTKLRHGISIDAMTSAGLVLLGGAIQRQFLPTERFTNRKEVASERFTRPDSYMAIGAVLDAVAMLAKFVAFEKLSAERCIALLLPVEGLYRAYRGGFCSRQTSTAITLVLAVALGILADFSNASTETHTIADNFTGYIALLCSIAATGCSMQQIRPEPHEYSFLGGAVLLASALCAYMFGVSQWSGNLVLEVIAILAGICACSWSATQPRAISTSLRISWPLVVTLTAFLSLNLLHTMNVSQAFSLALLYIALYRSVQTSGVASSAQSAANVIPSNLVSSKFGGYYINEILREKESRDIFYFLLLNLSFMVIQMLYGIWTNSLGLISDSIHMFFDCLALAVGLVAAVMSKWPASRSHPFGFAKVEIISGFANGIFLVLISFSIMIEAIERLMEPPEMTTDQLLLISTLGLGVNLVGIFAFNHGHHHGHSHGHSHSHGHGHDHETSPAPLPTIHTPRVDRHGGFADNIPGLRSPLVPNFSDFSGFDNSPEIVSDASPSNTDLREVNSNSLSAPEILSSNRTPVRSRSPIRRPGSPLKTAHEPVLADVAEQTELSSIKKENRVNLDDSHARHHDHNAEHDHLHNHNHECDHDHGHTHGHTHSKSLLSPINLHARSPSYDVRSDLVPSSKPPPHSQHHHHRNASLYTLGSLLTP